MVNEKTWDPPTETTREVVRKKTINSKSARFKGKGVMEMLEGKWGPYVYIYNVHSAFRNVATNFGCHVKTSRVFFQVFWLEVWGSQTHQLHCFQNTACQSGPTAVREAVRTRFGPDFVGQKKRFFVRTEPNTIFGRGKRCEMIIFTFGTAKCD